MERIRVLDVLRGIAILGILLANIEAFGRPQIEAELNPGSVVLTQSEWILEGFRAWFVSGKFRSLLAILFGIGLWMQYEKLSAVGEWPKVYLKRTLILLLIGVIHLLGIWFGDILTTYAVTAIVALALVGISEKAMWGILWGLGGFSILLGMLLGLVGTGTENTLQQLGEAGVWLTAEKETWAFAEGPWGVQFLYRLGMGVLSALNSVFAIFHLLPLFLFGMILARRNFFADRASSLKILRNGLVVGFLGLLLNAFPLIAILSGWKKDFGMIIELGIGALLSVGILMLTVVVYDWIKFKWVWRPLELVGRMALSNYLLQSLICTFVFYSFGLGWFGRFDRIEILQVVPVVWLINIVFSAAWLKFFSMGPVEYVWRSWVDGRWRVLRRSRA